MSDFTQLQRREHALAIPSFHRLPDFLYLGAAKCGSTWIFEALRAHPEVFVPAAKDLYFFGRAYHRGLDWYAEQFSGTGPQHKAVGELSVNYLHNENALKRIAQNLPEARLIVSLRNPIERAWSGYTFLRRNNSFHGSLAEAIDAGLPLVTEGGHYPRHLEAVERHLGGHPLLLLFFDDLQVDPRDFGRRIFGFLGVDETVDLADAQNNPLPAATPRSATLAGAAKWTARRMRKMGMVDLLGRIKSNQLVFATLYQRLDTSQRVQMRRDDWQRLRDLFVDEIGALESMTGRDLQHWLETPKGLIGTPTVAANS